MKNELAMGLYSRRSLTDSVARRQIRALSEFEDGLIRPDKCSEFEPARMPFDPANISKPIEWLAKPGGALFYRKGRPIHVSGAMWNWTHSPEARFPSPLFTNDWTGEFDGVWVKKVGIEKIVRFISEMFYVATSDFGFLTTEIDLKAKNTITTSLSYKGLDPAKGIPGLYWLNLFSDVYARWLGLEELPKELAVREKLAGGGVKLKFCESPDDCRSLEVLQKQQAAIDWIGREKFFDIRFPDRKAVTPEWAYLPLPQAESAR